MFPGKGNTWIGRSQTLNSQIKVSKEKTRLSLMASNTRLPKVPFPFLCFPLYLLPPPGKGGEAWLCTMGQTEKEGSQAYRPAPYEEDLEVNQDSQYLSPLNLSSLGTSQKFHIWDRKEGRKEARLVEVTPTDHYAYFKEHLRTQGEGADHVRRGRLPARLV